MNLGQKLNASEPQLPRLCAVQQHRSNTPGDTPEEYYCHTISIPFLDTLLSHLESRFSDIQQKSVNGMKIVPSVLMVKSCTHQELFDSYSEDLPSPDLLESELDLWKHKWQLTSSQQLPDSPANALVYASKNMYPNIHSTLHLICTLPVTSCECERSVSVLRRLKTYMRSTINGLNVFLKLKLTFWENMRKRDKSLLRYPSCFVQTEHHRLLQHKRLRL